MRGSEGRDVVGVGGAPGRSGFDGAYSRIREYLRSQARAGGSSCIVSMGWGSGLLAKTAWLDTDSDAYRQALKQVALYSRALQSGLPFPKTRRVLFLGNQPATLPGWGLVEVG